MLISKAMVRVTIAKEKLFGRNAYVIKVDGSKKFFEFTKTEAESKANKIRKQLTK